MIERRNRILPRQMLLRNERAEIAHDWAHIAMRQLEPRARERVRELIRMLIEAPRDFLVRRIEPQREVCGQHRGRAPLRGILRIRNRSGAGAILRRPLMRARRTLRQFPLVIEQVGEKVVAPLCWRFGPDDFEAAANRVCTLARAILALPSEALLLDRSCFRFPPDQGRLASAVRFAEGVATRD